MKGGDVGGWVFPLFPIELWDVRRNLVQYWRLERVVINGVISEFIDVGNV